MKSDKDLKQIAKDIYLGKIFTDRHISNKNMIASVFMPLIFLRTETKNGKNFIDSNPVLLYEYLDKAGPMAINDMPMFTSMQSLNKEEFDKMVSYYEKIEKTMSNI